MPRIHFLHKNGTKQTVDAPENLRAVLATSMGNDCNGGIGLWSAIESL